MLISKLKKHLRRSKVILLLNSFILFSCIDPINVNIDSQADHLVVDGLITDQAGPYEVKLSVTSSYFRSGSTDFSITSGAEMFILDDLGNIISLEEKASGRYQTPSSFMGEVGRTYILNIALVDGRIFKSLPEKLLPNVGIDTIRVDYLTKFKLNKNNVELGFDGMDVNIDTKTLEGNEPFYRWRYRGTYEVKTFPENQTKKVGDMVLADPPECSGYIPINEGRGKVQVGPCTCCICWIEEVNSGVLVSNATFVQGNIRNVNVRFIENQDSRFSVKYHVNIEQLSLTKEAHDFWKLIAQQQDQGSLFDQPVGTLPTNLYALNDPDEFVVGYFGASSIKTKSQFIYFSDIPAKKRLLPPINRDCRALDNSTNVRPPFW
jgi:hypothetical protein